MLSFIVSKDQVLVMLSEVHVTRTASVQLAAAQTQAVWGSGLETDASPSARGLCSSVQTADLDTSGLDLKHIEGNIDIERSSSAMNAALPRGGAAGDPRATTLKTTNVLTIVVVLPKRKTFRFNMSQRTQNEGDMS